MRVVVQRVQSAQVRVKDQVIGQIGPGLLLFVGITATDTDAELDWMVRKCLTLRLFPNPDQPESDRWDASIQDIQGALLVVSQFTLYGNCRKGRRPSFDQAAAPAMASSLYDNFVDRLKASGLAVATGQFGAHMAVELVNDGPVTLLLER